MPEDNKPISQKEAAKLLGVTERIMQSWRFRGIGPRFIRMGVKCVRYKPLELTQYLESRTIDPAAQGPKGKVAKRKTNKLTDEDLDKMARELRGAAQKP